MKKSVKSLITIFFYIGFIVFFLFSNSSYVQAQNVVSFNEFVVPTANSTPAGIVEGSDNNIWFTEFDGNKIARITPQGSITEFSVPTPNSKPVAIIVGPDNNLWFTEWSGNKIAQITYAGSFLEYAIPSSGIYIDNLTVGQDGNIWFSKGTIPTSKVGRVTLDGTFTEYNLPTPYAGTHGMTLGPDGNVWFTEYGANKVGKITPLGVITEYTIPTPDTGPFAIKVGSDGNLWFTEFWKPQIGRVTTDGVFTEFTIPSGYSTLFLTPGIDGSIWFTEPNGSKIGNITMAGIVTEYSVPTPNSFPHSITTDASGNIWFTEWYGNKVVRMTIQLPNQSPTVDAGGPYNVDEGGGVQVSATGNDPENGPLTYAWDLDNNGSYETPGQSVSFSASTLDGPSSQTIAVQATDNGNLTSPPDQATVNVNNVAPTVGVITAPTEPVLVNTQINTSTTFTDLGVPDTHTAEWSWGDGNTSTCPPNSTNCTLTESNGSGTVTGSHTYTTPGVYEVNVTVTDDDNAPDQPDNPFQYIVVYDNNANSGFVTGAGTINSPEGAYVQQSTLSGIARFGFVSKYQPGANIPTGNTQFKFQAAEFTFTSKDYQWLVVAGAQAKFKGNGTVTGSSNNYGFQLSATDGVINGGGGTDKFRIKIWDKDNNDQVIYDNNIGSSDNSNPTTEITGGNIVIH